MPGGTGNSSEQSSKMILSIRQQGLAPYQRGYTDVPALPTSIVLVRPVLTGVHLPKRQLFVDTFPLPRIRRNAKTPASSRESTGNSHNTSPKRPPRTQRKVQAPSHPTKQATPKPGHGPQSTTKDKPLTKNRAPKGQRSENADSTTEPETNSRNAKKPTAAVRQKTARNE